MANFVEVSRLEYTGAAGNELTTKTYHGLEIIVNNRTVGRISSYTPPTPTRTITPIKELNPSSYGRIIEQVPGVNSFEQTIQINRAEVWSNELEKAFGFSATFIDLMDQTRPFTLEERLFQGKKLYQSWVYSGCWFNSTGIDQYTTDGDSIVKSNCTITYTSRKKVSG